MRANPSFREGTITATLALLAAFSPAARAGSAQGNVSEETVKYFQQNCVSCHTIGGGRLTGPDLKGVLERRDRAWLVSFVRDPKAVIDAGDPYAQQIFQEARAVYMPTLPGMTADLADKLIGLIEYESTLEKSRFVGVQISERPFTPADLERGKAMFGGSLPFASGAPACYSCHSIAGFGGLGGGQLGPDLTGAYARLEGRKALAAWLSSPPSLTMQPVFQRRPLDGEEILALVAYLKAAAETGETEAPSTSFAFVIAGIAATAALLVAFDFLWRNRFRAVRQPLVARE
ncbi:MAG: c-type cytochrome [Planctomycetota bacterium]